MQYNHDSGITIRLRVIDSHAVPGAHAPTKKTKNERADTHRALIADDTCDFGVYA